MQLDQAMHPGAGKRLEHSKTRPVPTKRSQARETDGGAFTVAREGAGKSLEHSKPGPSCRQLNARAGFGGGGGMKSAQVRPCRPRPMGPRAGLLRRAHARGRTGCSTWPTPGARIGHRRILRATGCFPRHPLTHTGRVQASALWSPSDPLAPDGLNRRRSKCHSPPRQGRESCCTAQRWLGGVTFRVGLHRNERFS